MLWATLLVTAVWTATVQWDVQQRWGINQQGIADALGAARNHFQSNPQDIVVLYLTEGSFSISETDVVFNVDHIKPGTEGRLIIRGAGLDKTTLVMDGKFDNIKGRDVYRVTFSHMHFTRKAYTVTQGHVVSIRPAHVVLDIEVGFPTPLDIYDPTNFEGRFLRRYTNSRTNPKLDVPIHEGWPPTTNIQIPWVNVTAVPGEPRRWDFTVKPPKLVANYTQGDLIGVKSKHFGQTFWIYGGSNITFDHVKWTQQSRGVIRGGASDITFSNCVVDRSPPIGGITPALATPGGGPQIGQCTDGYIHNVRVINHTSTATGDDGIALFHVVSGEVSNNIVYDAFARGILLMGDTNTSIITTNNTLVRCPLFRTVCS